MKRAKLLIVLVGLLAGSAAVEARDNCQAGTAEIRAISEVTDQDQHPTCQVDPYYSLTLQYQCLRCGEPSGNANTATARSTGQCDVGQSPVNCLGRRPWISPLSDNDWRIYKQNGYRGSVGCRLGIQLFVSVYCSCPSTGECDMGSPIVVSLRDRRYELTSLACGVSFDLTSDGRPEWMSWTRGGSDEGFLFLDRNDNGIVDDGSELFGDYSPQPPSNEPNGFEALAMFDDSLSGGNEDGWITPADRIWTRLWLWIDDDHDGRSSADELVKLSDVGLEALGLSYSERDLFDEHGNWLRFESEVRFDDGREDPYWDIYFQIGTQPDVNLCTRG